MNFRNILFVLITSLLLIGPALNAAVPTKSYIDMETVETNLLEGLTSNNLGLRVSAAYYLGEYKSERAVLPLLKMLHNEKEEGARIQAALALIKIGNEKGVFMVKQASRFDESARVRNMCARFYNAYQNNKE